MIFFCELSIIKYGDEKMIKNNNADSYPKTSFPKMPPEPSETRLFPDEYMSGAASATECTGLIQVAPAEEDIQDAYGDIYSFRQSRPVVNEEEFKGHKH